MLIDDGLLAREGDRWVVTGDLSSVTVPPSIQALLASRLDRLDPRERSVLEAAAVAGKEFHVGAVRALLDEDARPGVREDLMALVRKELVRPDRSTVPGEDAFRFRHLLIRDAAYEALPKAQRAELHARFADWLERVAGSAVVEQEEIVAYHLEQAHAYQLELGPADERSRDLAERASARLASAGRRASGRGDFVAGSLLRRALALTPGDDPRRARLLYDLGDALAHGSDVRAALDAMHEALELASAAGDTSLEWLARLRHSDLLQLVDPHAKPTEEIRSELEQAVAVFGDLAEEAGLAATWIALALVEWNPCRFERAAAAAWLAVEHARASGDDRLVAGAILVLIAAQMFGPTEPEEAVRTIDELGQEIARSRQLHAVELTARGVAMCMLDRCDEARRLIRLAAEVAEGTGLGLEVAATQEELGDVELRAGDAAAAEAAFRRNYERLDAQGDEGHKSTAAANLARALSALGRYDEAERYAAIARSVAAEDDLSAQAAGRSAQALVLSARGEHDEAARLAREAVEMWREAEAPNAQGDAWMDLALVSRAAGNLTDATEAAREALALYERKGNRPSSSSTRAFLEELGADAP